MSAEVGLFEAKTRLSELVERVSSSGEAIVITRRGMPVARLLPIADGDSGVEECLALLLTAREASSPGPESLRELIDEGRDR